MRLVDQVLDLLRRQPYWKPLEPIASALILYVLAVMSAYQYVGWRHGLAPELGMFLRSYLVKQVTIVTAVVLACLLVLHGTGDADQLTRLTGMLRNKGRSFFWRGLAIAALMISGLLGVRAMQPKAVSNIQVAFLTATPLDKAALAYVLYELNARQESWHYDVRISQLNPRELRKSDRERCAEDRAEDLCIATLLAGSTPLIAITRDRLGEDDFWQMNPLAGVGVLSTVDWERLAPPSVYEFVAYAIIVQSTLIHLANHCGGLPARTLREARTGQGDLFAFVPGRRVMKAQVLAGRLTREGEELLLNCFGMQYVRDTRQVLTLEWLRDGEVRENLTHAFSVDILGPSEN